MAQEKYLGENGLKRLVELVKEDLGTKANIDGSYDGLQSGSAKQIVSPTGITDTTPYVFRTTCGETSISGGDEQLASLKAIRGNTIAWNQLISISSKANTTLNGITFTNNNDGSYTLNGTAAAQAVFVINQQGVFTKGHKYLVKGCPSGGSTSTYNLYIDFFQNDTGNGFIRTLNADLTGLNIKLVVENGTTVNNIVFRPQMFDLTQMFGPGNEPTSVLEFTRLFPKPYYPFNPGEPRNVKTKGLKTTGYNALAQLDTYEVGQLTIAPISGGKIEPNKRYDGISSNGYISTANPASYSISGNTATITNGTGLGYGIGFSIPVIPGKNYTFDFDCVGDDKTYRYGFYDKEGSLVGYYNGKKDVVIPDNCHICLVILSGASQNKTSIITNPCFHLAWSGSRTGYAPHEEHVLHIDTSRYFPDGMNGIDGVYDELTPKIASKRFAKVDLGTREWHRYETDGVYHFGTTLPDMKVPTTYFERAKGCRTPKYNASSTMSYATMDDKSWLRIGTGFAIRDDSYVDETAFKQAMNGFYLIYPLAEPVVTEIPQVRDNNWEIKVDDYGTEEWLFPEGDEIPVPVGHETLYMDNLVDKLRNLPEPSDYEALESEFQTLVKLPPLPTDTTKVYVPKFVNGTIKWVEE